MNDSRSFPPAPAAPAPAAHRSPAGAPPSTPARPQPPLREVLKGLEQRELEGQTVFDQLFGTAPPAQRR